MNGKKLIGALLGLSVALIGCNKTTLKNNTNPAITIDHPLDEGLPKRTFSYPTHAYDLTHALPEDHVKDGSVTYTAELQEALDKHKIVVMPNFPVQIDKPGLKVKSNSEIYFREKSVLKMATNSYDLYYMLLLLDVNNVKINNANLVGDRLTHTGTTGEWGMGIYISGSSDIEINSAHIKNCWGDGIYLGQDSWNEPSENVNIRNSVVDSNRRSGIAIISGNNINIDHCIIKNTYGPLISSGITLEANSRRNDINNINITNTITESNEKVGIRIASTNLNGAGGELKESNINISNYKDINSQFGISFVLGNPTRVGGMRDSNIQLEDCTFINNKGHAIVNYTEKNANVYHDVYMKNMMPMYNSTINGTQLDRIKNLARDTDYFHYID